MRIPQLLLGLTLAIAGLLVAAAFVPESPGAGVAPHPDHPSLLSGGAPASPVMWGIGTLFGLVQVAFFGACFALGMQRGGRLGPVARPLILGLLGYAGVWLALAVAYAATAGDGETSLWGAFPAATAWMLYGMWPFPIVFAYVYLRHFDSWFLNEDDLARFRARLAELEAERDAGPERPASGPASGQAS